MSRDHGGFSDDQRRAAFFAVAAVVVCAVVLLTVLGGKGPVVAPSAARSARLEPSGAAPRGGTVPRIVGAVSTQSTSSTASTASTASTEATTSTTGTTTARASATSGTAASSESRTPVSTPPGFQAKCHYETYPDGAIVPDPSCTPGALNHAAVANPRGTICTRGYSTRARRAASYTKPLKVTGMVSYGSAGPPSSYEEDQLVAPEDGGSPRDPKNLWPEYLYGTGGALQKDQAEDRIHELICSGKITVAQGASLLEGDWMHVLSSGSRPNP